MPKRIVVLVLAVALLAGLAACGRQDPRVGICLREESAQTAGSLEEVLTGAGYRVEILDASLDQSKQNRQVRQLLEEDYDLLVVEPVMVSEAFALAELARQADVPLIFCGGEPDALVLDSWEKLCYVGCDLAQPGLLQGQMISRLPDGGDINGDGIVSYYVIGGPEDHMDTRLRTTGCVTAMEEMGLQAQCLGSGWGNWSREDGQRLAAKAIAKFGKDIEVLVCNSDALAIGALEAIKDGGRTVGSDVYLLGIDGERHAQVLIRSGEMTGTVARDLQGEAEKLAELAQALLRGKTVEKVNYVDPISLTDEALTNK